MIVATHKLTFIQTGGGTNPVESAAISSARPCNFSPRLLPLFGVLLAVPRLAGNNSVARRFGA